MTVMALACQPMLGMHSTADPRRAAAALGRLSDVYRASRQTLCSYTPRGILGE